MAMPPRKLVARDISVGVVPAGVSVAGSSDALVSRSVASQALKTVARATNRSARRRAARRTKLKGGVIIRIPLPNLGVVVSASVRRGASAWHRPKRRLIEADVRRLLWEGRLSA